MVANASTKQQVNLTRIRGVPSDESPALHHQTAKNQAVYRFIVKHIRTEGQSPTRREIADGTGFSFDSIRKVLDALEDASLISRPIPGKHRRIVLPQAKPILQEPDITKTITIDPVHLIRHDTPKQAVFRFISNYVSSVGYGPANDEIAMATGFHLTVVEFVLRILRRDGLIAFELEKPRSIRLVETPPKATYQMLDQGQVQ